jgi:hypothetical protein
MLELDWLLAGLGAASRLRRRVHLRVNLDLNQLRR